MRSTLMKNVLLKKCFLPTVLGIYYKLCVKIKQILNKKQCFSLTISMGLRGIYTYIMGSRQLEHNTSSKIVSTARNIAVIYYMNTNSDRKPFGGHRDRTRQECRRRSLTLRWNFFLEKRSNTIEAVVRAVLGQYTRQKLYHNNNIGVG